MRIDDPIFSGSVVGSDAVVSLSGSFTGSGTIENAVTASKLQFSASFGLGIENTFNFDGSQNEAINIDTSSAHFVEGVDKARAADTASFMITGSISGLTQSFTKGDGSTFEINLPDTGAVDLLFEITGALGVDPFTFDNTANAQVQLDTSSAHFTVGVSASQAPIITALSASLTTTDQTISSSVAALSASAAAALTAQSASNAIDFVSESIYRVQTGSFVTTASISGLTQSFTKGDGSTFEINLPDTGSVDLAFEITGGLGVDAFTFDNTANAEVQVNTSSFHIANLTASLVQTSSISGLTQSFTKGDGSTYTNFLPDTGSFITTSSYSTGSIGGTPNTMSFTKGNGSTFDITLPNTVTSVTPSTANTLLAVGFEDGTTTSATIFSSSYAESSSFTRTATSASIADRANRVTASLSQALGIETFTFDGGTAATVQLDTSSAHFTDAVNAITSSISASLTTTDQTISSSVATLSGSASTARTSLSASLTTTDQTISSSVAALSGSASTARGALSASLTTTDQTISSSVAALSASAAAALTAQSASNAVDFVSQSIYNIQTGSFVTTASISGLTQSFTKGDGTTFEINLPDTGSPTLANQITGALGIEAFTFNGTADAQVQVDTSSAHFVNAVNTITSSLSASLTTTDQTISSSVAALSASASTSRIAVSASLTATDQSISSSVAILSSSAIFNVETSSTRQVDTLTITKGDGSTFDVTHDTSSFVKSVNGVAPNATTGNVSTSLTAVSTGTSASMLAASSSGNLDNGEVWIIAGQTGGDPVSGSGSNGESYIFDSGSGLLYKLANNDQAENDVRYVQVAGDTMTGALILSQDPTNVLGAATKQYVDPAFTTASVADGAGGSSILTFTRLGGGTETVTITSSISASYLSQADGKRIESTTGPGENYIELKQGAGDLELAARDNIIVNVDTNDGGIGTFQFQVNGVTSASIDQDGTGSFNWVDSTASYANQVRRDLTSGSGIEPFLYNGSQAASVALNTASAHFIAGVSKSFDGGVVYLTGSLLGTASKVENPLISGSGIVAFEYTGESIQSVSLDTSSAHFIAGVSSSIAGFTGSYSGSFTGSLLGTASLVEYSITSGSGILPFTYNGSNSASVSLDTASAHFEQGVKTAMENVSFSGSRINFSGSTISYDGAILDYTGAVFSGSLNFSGSSIDFSDVNFSGSTINWSGSTVSYDGADLDYSGATINVSGSTWNWSGSNFDLTDANLSGSRISFSGSTLDLSGAVIYANTASYSGSFNYSGSTINGGSYVGASFTGSSAFTGSFDFSNATVTGIAVSTNYLPTTQSTSFTAAAGRAYIVTQSAAVVTMTLPATPSNGDSIKLANMDDRQTIIARNGERIMGVAEDMTLNVEQVSFELMYESSTNMGWVIYGARAIT